MSNYKSNERKYLAKVSSRSSLASDVSASHRLKLTVGREAEITFVI